MKINELIERASKGECRAKANGDIYRDGYFVGSVESRRTGEVAIMDIANAELIAHALNNFMPMLEALEDMYTQCDNKNNGYHSGDIDLYDVIIAIKNAKEVA